MPLLAMTGQASRDITRENTNTFPSPTQIFKEMQKASEGEKYEGMKNSIHFIFISF